jgi:anaphase-promoting complex subunit 3
VVLLASHLARWVDEVRAYLSAIRLMCFCIVCQPLTYLLKHPPLRDRRRQLTTSRSRSIDSNGDEDANTPGEVAPSTTPTSNAQSPPPEASPAPSNWTAAHELAAQEAYELEMADHYIYDLLRRFARATRALSKYDCCSCLIELEQMPAAHQQSSWVLAMVGRAHYERLEYASVRNFHRRSCSFSLMLFS